MTLPLAAPDHEIRALDEGRAVVDLASYRKIRVRGSDAKRWLHDLVTADVVSLRPGDARRSLLLDPTGHIRADLQVACDREGFWLFQAPDQADLIDAALAPYVLSSDVRLDDLSSEHGLVAFPGSADRAEGFRPSVLGAGHDVLGDGDGVETIAGTSPDRVVVSADAVEAWRIRRGRARMGADFDRSSLPAEAGLEAAIDTTKGCFLGQESFARVRNLGHPPRLVMHLTGDGRVDIGTMLVDDAGADVGVVTSAAELDGGRTVVLAAVRWSAREAPLRTANALPLIRLGPSD